jgi:hypothetical protein
MLGVGFLAFKAIFNTIFSLVVRPALLCIG